MYRRSGIPNEANLTALEILELTTQQYRIKKRKDGSAAAPLAGHRGHGKIKTVKSSSSRRVRSRTARKS
jgi:hypothetical protein